MLIAAACHAARYDVYYVMSIRGVREVLASERCYADATLPMLLIRERERCFMPIAAAARCWRWRYVDCRCRCAMS